MSQIHETFAMCDWVCGVCRMVKGPTTQFDLEVGWPKDRPCFVPRPYNHQSKRQNPWDEPQDILPHPNQRNKWAVECWTNRHCWYCCHSYCCHLLMVPPPILLSVQTNKLNKPRIQTHFVRPIDRNVYFVSQKCPPVVSTSQTHKFHGGSGGQEANWSCQVPPGIVRLQCVEWPRDNERLVWRVSRIFFERDDRPDASPLVIFPWWDPFFHQDSIWYATVDQWNDVNFWQWIQAPPMFEPWQRDVHLVLSVGLVVLSPWTYWFCPGQIWALSPWMTWSMRRVPHGSCLQCRQ